MSLEVPTNCSFTVPVEESNTPQVLSQGRKGRKNTRANDGINEQNNILIDRNQQYIRELVTDSMDTLRTDMTNFIRNEFRSMVQNMGLGANNRLSQDTQPRDIIPPNSSPRTDNSPEPFVGEKVSNIIRNWRVKFSGCDDTLTVDEFIYRINILTTNNLNGDFGLLCRHAHGLFDGKALDWYWRYHRLDNELDWYSLTRALRSQYKCEFNDFDIMEDIYRRKQRPGECFDNFLDSVMAMSDRLKTPISDENLCAILVHNLRNEIRHELIHFDILNVAQLRREVKRHEKFMKEVNGRDCRIPAKGRVAEIDIKDSELNNFKPTEQESEVCAIRSDIKCWNCDKTGHTYFDCLDGRRVFCYGCGEKNVYRPTCTKCSVKPQGNGLKDVRRH